MTLCGYHFSNDHEGDWKDCAICREEFPIEMYVWYGTNEYNFEKLPNPPAFDPTLCAGCGERIVLGDGGYTIKPDGTHWCDECKPI